MESKNTSSLVRITYFTNDEERIVENEMEYFVDSPFESYQTNRCSYEKVIEIIVDYLKANTITPKEIDQRVRNIIKSIKKPMDFDKETEQDKFRTLLNTIPKTSKCFEQLCKYYEDDLWNADYYLAEEIDFQRDDATEHLLGDGFGPDTYIILGSNMGWRQKSGYKIAYLENERDMENAVTGDYDYMIEITRPDYRTPYLEASVWTHDNPVGESYIFIPRKNLNKALQYAKVKKGYQKFSKWIKEDLKSAC